jgi:hypothetical protein
MRAALLSLLLVLPPAAALPQHPAINPVGIWDLAFVLHGQETSAVLSITRDDKGSLKAAIELHGQQVELKAASVKERVVTFGNGLDLNLTLTFTAADSLTGTWERPEASGSLSGTRRKS